MSGTTTLELPRGARSAGIARLIVTAHGAGLPSERLKSANLMVSELVSNACRHGAGKIQLTVHSDEDGMRAEVCDEGIGAPDRPGRAAPERGGWGLRFVDQLSDSWGVGTDDSRVWFEVGLRAASRVSACSTRSRCGAVPPYTASNPRPSRRTLIAPPTRGQVGRDRGGRAGVEQHRGPQPALADAVDGRGARQVRRVDGVLRADRSRHQPRGGRAQVPLGPDRAAPARRVRGGHAARPQRVERRAADRRELGAREVVQRERGQRAADRPARRAPLGRDVRVDLAG